MIGQEAVKIVCLDEPYFEMRVFKTRIKLSFGLNLVIVYFVRANTF